MQYVHDHSCMIMRIHQDKGHPMPSSTTTQPSFGKWSPVAVHLARSERAASELFDTRCPTHAEVAWHCMASDVAKLCNCTLSTSASNSVDCDRSQQRLSGKCSTFRVVPHCGYHASKYRYDWKHNRHGWISQGPPNLKPFVQIVQLITLVQDHPGNSRTKIHETLETPKPPCASKCAQTFPGTEHQGQFFILATGPDRKLFTGTPVTHIRHHKYPHMCACRTDSMKTGIMKTADWDFLRCREWSRPTAVHPA